MLDTPARRLSQRLFKARYRLEVAAEIADHAKHDRAFCNKDLVRALGDPPGKGGISHELKTLRASGLIVADNTPDGGRLRYLRATSSGYWDACRELCEGAERYLANSDS